MTWAQRTSSGKYQPRDRIDGKIRSVGPCFQYRFQAEEWLRDEYQPTSSRQKQTAATRDGVADFLASLTPRASRLKLDDGLTVGAYAADWLQRRQGISHATLSYYRTQVVNGILGDRELSQAVFSGLSRDDVEHWLTRMEHAGVKVPTRNARLKVLRMVCTAAAQNPAVDLQSDPSAGIRRKKPDLKPRKFMSDDDVTALLDVVGDDDDFRLAVLLAADAGLRWAEITGLAASSVTIRRGESTILVWQSARRDGTVEDRTKNGTERSVPVMSRRLQVALSLATKKARLRSGPDGLVLAEADGQPLRYAHWLDKLDGAYAAAGIHPVPVGWHDLRHTFGSRLAEKGIPTKMIASLMGHSDQRVTELYMHDSHVDTMRRVVGGAFAGL